MLAYFAKMATESSECWERKPVEKGDQIEQDLQSIIKKLKVNNKPRKGSLRQRIKCTRTKPSRTKKLPDKSKKIIQDAKFVFTRTTSLMANTFEDSNIKQCEVKDQKTICGLKLTEIPITTSVAGGSANVSSRIQGCGEQFRNEANIKMTNSINMDDTTPAELAAYFDQLLHIPKPMSQMAEMMYT